MNLIQIGAVVMFCVISFLAPYCEALPEKDLLFTIVGIVSILLMLITMITAIIFTIKEKENRKEIALLGIRNILLIPCGFFVSFIHQLSWHYYEDGQPPHLGEIWMWEFALYAGLWAVAAVLLYEAGKKLLSKRNN